MKSAAYTSRLLLLIAVAVSSSCSSRPTANSNPTSNPAEIKTGPAAEFELRNAWKPAKVIVQGYSSDKFTLTAKPGTQFVAVELKMKTDDAAAPVAAAMWPGTTLIDSKGDRHQLVFSYASTLVKYQPHGDTVEYAGSETIKPGELLSKTLKDTGGTLVVVFHAPEKETRFKLEIAKGATLDISLAEK